MRILYVTDLHGARWKYEKTLEVAKDLKSDIIINGGDMLPVNINFLKQGVFITDFLDNYFARINQQQIYYLSYLGNDDLKIFDDLFQKTCEQYTYIIPLAQKRFLYQGYEFIGMNWVVDYPFGLKDRCRMDHKDYQFQRQIGKAVLSTKSGWNEIKNWKRYAQMLPTLKDELENLIKPKNMEKAIYIIHMPPSEVGLDVCNNNIKVGSDSIYDFIKKNQPLMTLHGHIHECPNVSQRWKCKIGSTFAIQPGQSSHSKKELIYIDIIIKFDKVLKISRNIKY